MDRLYKPKIVCCRMLHKAKIWRTPWEIAMGNRHGKLSWEIVDANIRESLQWKMSNNWNIIGNGHL